MIITLASSKGGVGKSTAAACLAGAYAKAGFKSHIVDLDNNHTVARWLSDASVRPSTLTVSAPEPDELTTHLRNIKASIDPDVILIDVAGAYERALTVAVARANLTIIPACPTEPDVYEASRIAGHVTELFKSHGKKPLYRLLLSRVQPLVSHSQAHAYREIGRLHLPLFRSMFILRAAYEEIGLTGKTPHFGDKTRQTVAKAVSEIDALTAEIDALIEEISLQNLPTSEGAAA